MELSPAGGVTIFVTIMVLIPTGYMLAWRSGRPAARRAGALIVSVFCAMAGLVCAWVALGMLFDWPGAPFVSRILVSLIPIVVSVGPFYLAVRFARRATKASERNR